MELLLFMNRKQSAKRIVIWGIILLGERSSLDASNRIVCLLSTVLELEFNLHLQISVSELCTSHRRIKCALSAWYVIIRVATTSRELTLFQDIV